MKPLCDWCRSAVGWTRAIRSAGRRPQLCDACRITRAHRDGR